MMQMRRLEQMRSLVRFRCWNYCGARASASRPLFPRPRLPAAAERRGAERALPKCQGVRSRWYRVRGALRGSVSGVTSMKLRRVCKSPSGGLHGAIAARASHFDGGPRTWVLVRTPPPRNRKPQTQNPEPQLLRGSRGAIAARASHSDGGLRTWVLVRASPPQNPEPTTQNPEPQLLRGSRGVSVAIRQVLRRGPTDVVLARATAPRHPEPRTANSSFPVPLRYPK